MIVLSRSFFRKRVILLATTASVAATSFALAQNPTGAHHGHGVMPVQYGADRHDYADEQPFLSKNDTAMNRMMTDMAIKPTGDVDRDSVATPTGKGRENLRQLDIAGRATHLVLSAADEHKPAQEDSAPSGISLFDQGLIQVLQVSVTGLEPKQPHILALSQDGGEGPLEPLAAFVTNPAGAAIVNATGPIRQVVHGEDKIQRGYLVVAEGVPDKPGRVVQVQLK
jgi:hypothetical protein